MAGLVSAWLLAFFIIAVNCGSARAEKRYVFREGSRQAVEVDVDAARSRPQASSRVYYRRPATKAVSSAGGGTTPSARAGSRADTTKRSYHYTDTVDVDGLNRKFYVFVPDTYSPSSAAPVMLVFHGLRMSAESMPAITGFNGIARRNNFVVVYCQSLGSKWNDGMNNSKGVDDVKYVEAVLKKLAQRVNMDNRHIFAVGLSNGGYFVQLLASRLDNRIAGIAVVASTAMSQALSDPGSARAVPAVFFLGTEDALVNWSDGKNRSLGRYADKVGLEGIDPNFYKLARYGGWMSADDMIAYWTKRNRSTGSGQESLMPDTNREDGMRVRRIEYGSRGNAVTVYKIEGGMHSWPGALTLPGSKIKSCQDINAGELIWKFFRLYAW